MADKEEVIDQFANVTGVDRSRARFHLESAAWNLEVAMANFYEEGEHVDDGSAAHPVEIDEMGDDEEAEQFVSGGGSGGGSGREASGRAPKSNSRFATIGSLRGNEGGSSSDEEGQAFYAGGSERSGQQVLGPSKKKKNPDALVSDLFKSAREHGAEELDRVTEQQAARPVFHGTGYRLGETEDASETIAGPSMARSRPQVDMVLKMWKNGFSVDDGPLRPYDDPANKDFLDSIRRGEVPNELIHLARGGEVNLNMEDHRQEDYMKPKAAVKVFSGEGHMLGSPAPAVMATAGSPSVAAASGSPKPKVQVNSAQPVTTIQIRLADGNRMVEKFNLSHTVGDIRNHIIVSHPQYASTNFVLMTTFPNKELTSESQTLEEAKLANAVIVQKLK